MKRREQESHFRECIKNFRPMFWRVPVVPMLLLLVVVDYFLRKLNQSAVESSLLPQREALVQRLREWDDGSHPAQPQTDAP